MYSPRFHFVLKITVQFSMQKPFFIVQVAKKRYPNKKQDQDIVVLMVSQTALKVMITVISGAGYYCCVGLWMNRFS